MRLGIARIQKYVFLRLLENNSKKQKQLVANFTQPNSWPYLNPVRRRSSNLLLYRNPRCKACRRPGTQGKDSRIPWGSRQRKKSSSHEGIENVSTSKKVALKHTSWKLYHSEGVQFRKMKAAGWEANGLPDVNDTSLRSKNGSKSKSPAAKVRIDLTDLEQKAE